MKLLIPIIIISFTLFLLIFGAKFVLALFSSAFNMILGLVLVVALIIIVVWMFAYARKSR